MTPQKFQPFSAVAVRWVDATSRAAGWQEPQQEYKLGSAYTVGIVIAQDAESITLAQSLITMDETLRQVSEPISLPWGMIKSIKEVQIMATKKMKKVAKKTTKKGN